MKLRYIIFAMFAFALLLNTTGCSKSPKDKVIQVLNKTLDYLNSDKMDKAMSDMEEGHSKNEDEITKIIKDAGFATLEDFDKEMKNYIKDADVIELNNKIQDKMVEKMNSMKQMQMDKSYHDMNSNMDSTGDKVHGK
jgi:hypothetical protein